MSDNYLAYTYIIGWKKEQKFYYGVRWDNIRLKKSPEEDLWITYFTSSKNQVPVMRTLYGEPDLIKIHRKFENKQEAILFEEQMLLRFIHSSKRHLWLNETANKAIPMTSKIRKKLSKIQTGKKQKDKTIQKRVQSLKGRKNYNNGFQTKRFKPGNEPKGWIIGTLHKLTEKHKLKIRKSCLGINSKKIEIDGVIYSSQRQAAKQCNVSPNTIVAWVKNGKATRPLS